MRTARSATSLIACVMVGCGFPGPSRYETHATYRPTSGAYTAVTFDALGSRPRGWDIGETGDVELGITTTRTSMSILVKVDGGRHSLGRDDPARGWSSGDHVDAAFLERFMVLAGAGGSATLTDEAAEIDRLLDDAVAGPKGEMPRSTAHLSRIGYSSTYR